MILMSEKISIEALISIPVAGAFCLSMGALYNFVYFLVLDINFYTFLTYQDHLNRSFFVIPFCFFIIISSHLLSDGNFFYCFKKFIMWEKSRNIIFFSIIFLCSFIFFTSYFFSQSKDRFLIASIFCILAFLFFPIYNFCAFVFFRRYPDFYAYLGVIFFVIFFICVSVSSFRAVIDKKKDTDYYTFFLEKENFDNVIICFKMSSGYIINGKNGIFYLPTDKVLKIQKNRGKED